MNFKSFSFLLIICFFSCNNHNFSDKKDLIKFIKSSENGYFLTKKINGVTLSLMYKPTDLLVAQELQEKSTKEDIERLRNKYNKYLYFNLSISKNNKEVLNASPRNRQEYGEMVNQFAYYFQEKVHLFNSHKDTIAIADYVYPRLYGMTNTTSILLAYPKSNQVFIGEEFFIAIEDFGLHTGEVKFKFQSKKFNNEPSITFKK